jgi:hypothetical protein
MASIEVSPDIRSRLRQFLTDRFSLSELKDLSFDLGVDYEMFPHQTKGELSRELLGYFERKQNLSCLVAEMARQRPDDELVTMLAELGSCSPRSKVQIVLPADKLENRESLLSELAKVLGVTTDEVMLIATAPGSIRLLVSLPAEAAEQLMTLNPDHLGEAYEITSIDNYDSLSPEEQASWRQAALKGKPPAPFLGLSSSPLILAGVVVGVLLVGTLIAGAILTTAAIIAVPRVKVTNSCSVDILEQRTFPIIGDVTIDLVIGESKSYPIPPGDYEFHYDGQIATGRAPLVGELPEFSAPGGIDALYENQLIPTNRTIRDSISLGGRRAIILCPSGN